MSETNQLNCTLTTLWSVSTCAGSSKSATTGCVRRPVACSAAFDGRCAMGLIAMFACSNNRTLHNDFIQTTSITNRQKQQSVCYENENNAVIAVLACNCAILLVGLPRLVTVDRLTSVCEVVTSLPAEPGPSIITHTTHRQLFNTKQ